MTWTTSANHCLDIHVSFLPCCDSALQKLVSISTQGKTGVEMKCDWYSLDHAILGADHLHSIWVVIQFPGSRCEQIVHDSRVRHKIRPETNRKWFNLTLIIFGLLDQVSHHRQHGDSRLLRAPLIKVLTCVCISSLFVNTMCAKEQNSAGMDSLLVDEGVGIRFTSTSCQRWKASRLSLDGWHAAPRAHTEKPTTTETRQPTREFDSTTKLFCVFFDVSLN